MSIDTNEIRAAHGIHGHIPPDDREVYDLKRALDEVDRLFPLAEAAQKMIAMLAKDALVDVDPEEAPGMLRAALAGWKRERAQAHHDMGEATRRARAREGELKRLRARVDELEKERDEAHAEVERLQAEVARLKSAAIVRRPIETLPEEREGRVLLFRPDLDGAYIQTVTHLEPGDETWPWPIQGTEVSWRWWCPVPPLADAPDDERHTHGPDNQLRVFFSIEDGGYIAARGTYSGFGDTPEEALAQFRIAERAAQLADDPDGEEQP